MLTLRRAFELPALGISYKIVEYAHPAFRVRVERYRNVVYDESLLYPNVAWSGYGDRPRVDVVLRGRVRNTENGVVRWLQPGSFTIGRALESLYQRAQFGERDPEAPSEDGLLMSVEYTLGSLGTNAPTGLPMGLMNAVDMEGLGHEVDRLLTLPSDTGEGQRSLFGAIAAILARLRSAGLPFDAWKARDLAVATSAALQRTADAVGRALSCLDARPASGQLDTQLGLSRRRVAALVSELATSYGFNGLDWRSWRDRWRLSAGVIAMSHSRARTEDVARAIGYGSPNAFCHAFRAAGLPSPGALRAALALAL